MSSSSTSQTSGRTPIPTPNTATYPNIPRYVSFTSPVSLAPAEGTVRATTLPLNLIGLIVSYLDDIGDIARVTRTSRLLYYMTLPQLYAKVALHSYPEIRYINGRPEGFGSGSPFIMGLNGLVTKPHANLVKELRLWGEWRDSGSDDFAKGRVPDNSMMLNILVRAAMDKMIRLQSFSWEIVDSKPLKTVYQGLASHNTLSRLTLQFPSSRLPRPSCMIPPLPNLRAFMATDIDPLCYPDDISVMLLGSKKLEDLRLHFSPRMRREAESSLSLETYFGRCNSADYRLPLKHFAMQNFYGPNNQVMNSLVNEETCTSLCFLDTFGGAGAPSRNIYVDATWRFVPPDAKQRFKVCRCNEAAAQHIQLLSQAETGLERFYFVNARAPKTGRTPNSPSVPVTPEETPPDMETMALGKEYLYALTRHHGSTLKHLLLSEQWVCGEDEISEIVRHCPNLEQLGLAVNAVNMNTVRLLIPFLPKLTALRILANEPSHEIMQPGSECYQQMEMGIYLDKSGAKQLRWIGVGDKVYHAGERRQTEKGEWRRDITEASRMDVEHIEIWKLDSPDISKDPVQPFGP